LSDDDATIGRNGSNQTDDDDDDRSASNTRRYSTFYYDENLYERYCPEIMDDATNMDPEFMASFSTNQEFTDKEPFCHDSDSKDRYEDMNGKSTDLLLSAVEQQQTDYDLDTIRRRIFKYEQEQLKGVQLANAGKENLKIINSYSVTSTTCNLL
jgi:hypothetical protein